MKSLKYVKKLKEESTILSKMIELYCDKINKEHQKHIHMILENIDKKDCVETNTKVHVRISETRAFEQGANEDCKLCSHKVVVHSYVSHS